ncbi:hypothetical protein YC2023_036871 [Brassica napus]
MVFVADRVYEFSVVRLLPTNLFVFDFVFLVVGLPSIVSDRFGFQDLVFGVLISFIASLVALPFTMFATRDLDNVFVRVCGVSLLELWSLLSRVL